MTGQIFDLNDTGQGGWSQFVEQNHTVLCAIQLSELYCMYQQRVLHRGSGP